MATTDFGALSEAQKRVWSLQTWRQGLDESFFFAAGMVGRGTEDVGKPVHLVTELTETGRGHQVIMQLVAELAEDGTAGDNILTGNEEALINDEQIITIDQFRHGVKNKGKMSEQRTVLRFRAMARQKLTYWLGNKIDEMAFLVTSGTAFTLNLDNSTRAATSQLPQLAFAGDVTAATANRTMYAGTATSTATLTANDKMTWKFVVEACAFAKRKRIKPVRVNGRQYYCLVMSTEQARDLKIDSDYMTNVGRAHHQGERNPLFTGAFAVIDNVMLYEHPKCFTTQGNATKWGAGSNVEGAVAMLLGAQAIGFARIGDPSFAEADVNDYNNQPGLAYGRMIGFKKPVYRSIYDSNNDADFGVVVLDTAAAQSA